MADPARLDLATKGEEARLRAHLEDFVDYYKGVYPERPLALAVWFEKSPGTVDHNLLVLFTGRGRDQSNYIPSESDPLFWKTGSSGPPCVNIHSTSVDYFAGQLSSNPQELAKYRDRFEVLYFDKERLTEPILRAFNVITEPSGLLKGWYVSADEIVAGAPVQNLLSKHSHSRPEIGLVKVYESEDFKSCRGLLHIEVSQRWLPMSPGALTDYSFYRDLVGGHPGYFLFQGGSLYQLLRFETKTVPEYSSRVLEKLRNGSYPEVYLRAVHASEGSAA